MAFDRSKLFLFWNLLPITLYRREIDESAEEGDDHCPSHQNLTLDSTSWTRDSEGRLPHSFRMGHMFCRKDDHDGDVSMFFSQHMLMELMAF